MELVIFKNKSNLVMDVRLEQAVVLLKAIIAGYGYNPVAEC